jgi:acyl-CoA synthetase (AMP-forming)/AMP-acid ligase II
MLVSDIVRRNAEFFPDGDAVVVPGQPVKSWSTLLRRSHQLARAFGALGVHKGDRVAMYAPNCGEFVEFFFGCAISGVVGAATNVRLAGAEAAAYLRYVEPTCIVVHADVAATARTWLADVFSVRHVIGIGQGHGFDLDYETLLAAQEPTDPGIAVDDTDTYQFGATSGTTGVPKAAILTHRNAIASMLNWTSEIPIGERATNLQNIPMFFNPGGPAGLHPVLLKGGRTVLFPSFDPVTFLRAVPEYAVTHTILVPSMIQMVLAQPDCEDYDVSTLQGITWGGSSPSAALLERSRQVFGDVFFPFYGMAETYSCGLVLRREHQHPGGTADQIRQLASAGKPHVLMQVRVVDREGKDVPPDNSSPGEIWMRGDSVSPGYFRMPEETESSREGAWLKSGDVAVVDAEGFVTIVDRLKDMIITGGINVFSREVEDVLLQHPAVQTVAVIGIPHERWGESIHAVVVADPGGAVTEDELLSFAQQRLTHYKRPRSIQFVEQLPLSATGKVLKKQLRGPFWEQG